MRALIRPWVDFIKFLGAQKFKSVFENVFEIALEVPSKGKVLCC
jgi:hypothetical protein